MDLSSSTNDVELLFAGNASATQPPSIVQSAGPAPAEALLYSLLAIFSAIGAGVLSVRLGFVDVDGGDMKALRFYVGKIAFPLLIFQTVATSKLGAIDLTALAACVLSKATIMCLVFVLAFCFYRSSRSVGRRLLAATCFAFFSIASDDFAIGFPVINALYPPEDDMDAYIAANAVVGSLVFVPLTMALFEIGTSLLQESDEDTQTSAGARCASILLTVVMNPVICCTLLGIIYRLALPGTLRDEGTKLPYPLYNIVKLLTSAFGMLALYSTGTVLRSPQVHLWPLMLCTFKVIICAYLCYFIGVQLLGLNQPALNDFTFFYGSIPTSSAPLFFTVQFDPDSADVIASATLFGLLFAGPVMLETAFFLQSTQEQLHMLAMLDISVVSWSILCGALVLWLLYYSRAQWNVGGMGKATIAIYGVAIWISSLIVYSLATSPTSMCGFSDASPSAFSFVLSWLQRSCCFLLLFLQFMMSTRWTQPSTLALRIECVVACFALAVVPGYFVIPNSVVELCEDKVGGLETAAPSNGDVLKNLILNCLLFVVVVVIALCSVLQAVGVGHKDPLGSTGGRETAEALEHGAAARPTTTHEGVLMAAGGVAGRLQATTSWQQNPPTRVARALVTILGVRLLMQVVNLTAVLHDVSLRGSVAAMLFFEHFFELGQPIILLFVLVMDDDFSAHLKELVKLPGWLSFGRYSPDMFHPTLQRRSNEFVCPYCVEGCSSSEENDSDGSDVN